MENDNAVFVLRVRLLYHMETKKKHSEEVAELNEQIDFVFGSLPSLLQVHFKCAVSFL